jgi:nitrite reductase (cytochrome c-552)
MTDNVKPARAPHRLRRIVLVAAAIALLLVFGITALLVNIFQHKQEARNPFFRVVEIDDNTIDPAVWGKNFPLQYDSYRRTVDMKRTRFGGSEALPRTPTQADPRSTLAESRLDEDPRLRIMWAGYAFSKDFREERGHAYMLEDQLYTERQQASPQPGTCIHCHASTYVPYRLKGDGDISRGFAYFNHLPYGQAKNEMQELLSAHGQKLHPVACIDCHDPQTLALRVTRPGFIEGIRAFKAAQGVPDYDVNKMATRQEMRTFVCGQCHVEYYFQGPEKRLTYPWSKGLRADQILSYYEENQHKDWVHAETGAPALKAQHPEFEMWNQGIHARSGVACADCHMPYVRVGALKISDHHVRSPLLNINNACQTCHKVPEDELLARATTIQQRTFELRNRVMDALVEFIGDIKAARSTATPQQLAAPLNLQRKAQFLLDFIEAENSMGFHADQEAARVLALSLDHIRTGQITLRDALHPLPGKATATTSSPP